MSEQTLDNAKSQSATKTRQRSTIAFPYMSLSDAEAMAQAIHTNVGNGDCSIHQLSAWIKQSAKSSGFRTQIAAARLFGVIESEGVNTYRLTTLGRRLVDPSNARGSRAEAFLAVPLFHALFDKHKDGILPPAAALEREIASVGVAEKQKNKARQVFERSAEQAAFFEHGKNRLVMPGVASNDEKLPPGGKGGGGGNSLNLDPLLLALLQKIPSSAEDWPAEKRVRWFRTFAMNVSQVYDEDDKPVELNISLASGDKPLTCEEGRS